MWKPLGLMVLAGLTPEDWQTSIVDENLGVPDYRSLPRPDLVGITAFTSQANRAYDIAAHFRALGVPVVMGGIHATMCPDEAAATRGLRGHQRGGGGLAPGSQRTPRKAASSPCMKEGWRTSARFARPDTIFFPRITLWAPSRPRGAAP